MPQGNTKWFTELLGPDLIQMSPIKTIHYEGTTSYQNVKVLELRPFGRCLVLDGKTQSTEMDEFVYHEALVHPALLTHPSPKRVFIAGGGEGATLREVLAHNTVEQAIMVDIDQEVVELCRQYLPNHHQGSFDDLRTHLLFQDAKVFLEENPEHFDVMVLDLPDPLENGPATLLYTQSFFRLVQERLNPDGLMVVQSGTCGPNNYTDIFPAIHNTLETIFPIVRCYSITVPSFGSPWGFTIASLTLDPAELTSEEVELRLEARVARSLQMYDGVAHQGMFALPKYLRKGLDDEDRIITEESPIFVV